MNNPSPQYNVQNEAIYRTDMEQRDLRNVKKDQAVPFLLFLDETDGSVQRVSVVSGVLTVVAV